MGELRVASVLAHGLVAGPMKALDGFRRRGQRVEARRPAGATQPVWVRAGTTDVISHVTVILYGEYKMPLRAGPPKVIFDLGANIGLTAIWYAGRYPNARIICVECEPANYDLLVANTCSYPQVEALHAAIWSVPTTLTVTDPGEGAWGYQVHETAARGHEVEAVTVDGLMERFGIDRVDLLKIDVEGAEAAVFADPSAWIGQVGAIAGELHESIVPGVTAVFTRATAEFPLRSRRGKTVQVERG